MITFLHIPKVAGSSFYKLTFGNDYVNYWGHKSSVGIPSPSFCFVRNPYDRLVAAYFYLIDDHAEFEPDISYKEMLLKYKDFKDFVMNIETDRLNKYIIHVKPMSYYICDDDGNILIDKIFKIEKIKEIDDYLQDNGIPKLSETILNTSEHKKYTEYLDDEVIAEINRLYKQDFELFNYEML